MLDEKKIYICGAKIKLEQPKPVPLFSIHLTCYERNLGTSHAG